MSQALAVAARNSHQLTDPESIERVRSAVLEEVHRVMHQKPIHPVIEDFQQLIASDPVARMMMTEMIREIPDQYKAHHPKTVEELLLQLNAVLTIAPPYIPPGHGEATALVGTPFSAILIWTMGTPSGLAAYRYPAINAMFRRLLLAWTGFLDSTDSRYVLNPGPIGWQSEAAQKQLDMEDYVYEPDAKYWGFKSWNDFFTRPVKPGKRPIADPHDPRIITSACDSQVYRIARDAKRSTPFWAKREPYSLHDMLDGNYVEEFVGGDVYQAFLSPFNYHRWHSPVAGKVVKAYIKEGLLFSQDSAWGEDPTDQDHSEGYIAHVQTRALIFIEADDPVGLICVMPIGMVEISTCVIDPEIRPGARVEKGQELGYFQFGGSTHCVLFRPGVIKEFTGHGPSTPNGSDGSSYLVGQVIAKA
ncbi:MAG: phosphatidylserine decarboxylase family protein [Acidobacteriota bacterium]